MNEQVLQEINRDLITLTPEYVNRNNYILRVILDIFIDAMRDNDGLFRRLYNRPFYGGSFYDRVRIKQPDEFDLDLLLDMNCSILPGKIPGHVKVKLLDYKNLDEDDEILCFIDNRGFVLTYKILDWFKSVVHKALGSILGSIGNRKNRISVYIENKRYEFYMIFHDHGPAQNLELKCNFFTINIDFVPCILFRTKIGEIFAVPMSPKIQIKSIRRHYGIYDERKRTRNRNNSMFFYRYFRVSYQEQEREILKGRNFLKPCLRLLKLLRDSYNHHQIASYYLKNLMLNLTKIVPDEFWFGPLSDVFVEVLSIYMDVLQDGVLSYYWDKHYNLLENIDRIRLQEIANSIRHVCNTVINSKNSEDIIRCFY